MSSILNDVSLTSEHHVLLAYVADLELEVDRLRKQWRHLQHEVLAGLKRIRSRCGGPVEQEEGAAALTTISGVATQLEELIRDLHESPGYHPAHDQVVAIAVRPLIEQVFRWQGRLWNVPDVQLRLELMTETVDWFPARLRHILDNLISNALKYRDSRRGETRITVGLNNVSRCYELRITDNGLGMPPEEASQPAQLFYRSAPARSAGLGVGLPVVRMLVEQAGGSMTVQSGNGQGTTVVATLPRFDVDDFVG